MSDENPISSIAKAVAEIARQILASHDVDVGDMFDLEVDAGNTDVNGSENGHTEGEAANPDETAFAAFDVSIRKPEEAVADYVKDNATAEELDDEEARLQIEEKGRQEYADYLVEQIRVMQEKILGAEMDGGISAEEREQMDRAFDRLGLLMDDIIGGKTDMDSLKGYYDRLTSIQNSGSNA